MNKSLLQKLKEHNVKPYHMPGHKRRSIARGIPYDIDITEIEGFDNLHNPCGILKDLSERASRIYGALRSYPLVNGSTCGVLAGIYSLTRDNKNILVARNCHKSVYHAVEILDLNPRYLMPELLDFGIMGRITPEAVDAALCDSDIKTVVITSPTYEGVISDVSGIYDVCKKHGARLFLDSAHGAHLTDKPLLCDMCVMSLHKTLPALTQTALLHIYSDSVDENIVSHSLSIFETSSPSYVLMASIDECLRYIEENKKDFTSLESNLSYFYENTIALDNMKVIHFDDRTKIIITTADGYDLAQKLRTHNIEVEMASEYYVIAIVTPVDKLDDLQILLRALCRIDKTLLPYKIGDIPEFTLPERQIIKARGELLDISDCSGRISDEYIWAYPPGVPIVTPNEVIDEKMIDYLKSKKHLNSTKGKFPKIYVKKEI